MLYIFLRILKQVLDNILLIVFFFLQFFIAMTKLFDGCWIALDSTSLAKTSMTL